MGETLIEERIESIAECAEKACVIEASADKPGNISPEKPFRNTTFNDFLAGSKALKKAVSSATLQGLLAGKRKITFQKIGVGANIKKAVSDVKSSHNGGNTHLGIALLFIPISSAAGLCLAEKKGFDSLRDNIRIVMNYSSVEDAISFYEAVNIAEAGGLPDTDLDVRRDESKERITREGITFKGIMKRSSENDTLARELCSEMPIIFDVSYPLLSRLSNRFGRMPDAVVQTYLALLSRYPDTLIAKKVGLEKSREVSEKAKEVLDAGGILTDEGKNALKLFDCALRADGNKLNPGTTADLIAASIFVMLLKDALD